MNDLRVLFDPGPDGSYHVHLKGAGGKLGVQASFTPFLEEDDYEDLRWYLEEFMDLPDGGAVVRAQRIERELGRWGRQFYDALFSTAENRALLKDLLAGPEPRTLTLATQDSRLLRLPWELMADDAGNLAQRVSYTLAGDGQPMTCFVLVLYSLQRLHAADTCWPSVGRGSSPGREETRHVLFFGLVLRVLTNESRRADVL